MESFTICNGVGFVIAHSLAISIHFMDCIFFVLAFIFSFTDAYGIPHCFGFFVSFNDTIEEWYGFTQQQHFTQPIDDAIAYVFSISYAIIVAIMERVFDGIDEFVDKSDVFSDVQLFIDEQPQSLDFAIHNIESDKKRQFYLERQLQFVMEHVGFDFDVVECVGDPYTVDDRFDNAFEQPQHIGISFGQRVSERQRERQPKCFVDDEPFEHDEWHDDVFEVDFCILLDFEQHFCVDFLQPHSIGFPIIERDEYDIFDTKPDGNDFADSLAECQCIAIDEQQHDDEHVAFDVVVDIGDEVRIMFYELDDECQRNIFTVVQSFEEYVSIIHFFAERKPKPQ